MTFQNLRLATYGITFFPFAPDNKGGVQNAVSFYTTKSLRKPDMPTHWAETQCMETGKKLEVVWELLLHCLSDTSNINKDILDSCILSGNKRSNFLDVRLCHRDREKRIIKTQQKYIKVEKSTLHTQLTTLFPPLCILDLSSWGKERKWSKFTQQKGKLWTDYPPQLI